MAQTPAFEVVTDNSKRILGFNPAGHDTVIAPEAMVDYLNGDDRLTYRDQEYDITESGSLIHVDVEVPTLVKIGRGTFIGAGVVFEDELAPVHLGDRARISNTTLHADVDVGNHAVILDSSIGSKSEIGDYARIRPEVWLGSGVILRDAVKVDRESSIHGYSSVGFASKLGYRTIIRGGVTIGELCNIGFPIGGRLTDSEREGILISEGVTVKDRSRVEADKLF